MDTPNKATDTEYEDHTLNKVTPCKGGWEIGHDGWIFFCPETDVAPRVGTVARFYGRGFGFPVRGLDLDGHEVFYRTAEEDRARHAQQVADEKQRKREVFEATGREKLDADYATLPPAFQARIDHFRRVRSDFRWEMEPYEMMVCIDAAKIARALGSADAVTHFYGLPWEEQLALVPGLDDGHSGNSFGAACELAQIALSNPDLVDKAHGALCPLVGCEDYGCYAATKKDMTP